MAIDPNPKHQPNKVGPARNHAPAGAANTSKAASGGQDISPDGVNATPSMAPRPHSVRGEKGSFPVPTDTTGADA